MKVYEEDSLREPVEFKTERGRQSGSKLTRSESGSELELNQRCLRVPLLKRSFSTACKDLINAHGPVRFFGHRFSNHSAFWHLPSCSDDFRWVVLVRCAGDFMFYLPSYAAAFRCIGQELQSQNIEVFELKSRADVFRLQCGDPNPPFTGLKELLFSKETLQMIDREGRRRRGQSTGEIRFDSTSEMLRTVGQYIDTKLGRLRWINNSGSSSDAAFELEYQTRAGQVQMETLPMSFIREASVRMYQRRTDLNDPVNLLTRKR